MARSTFYYHVKREKAKDKYRDAKKEIKAIFKQSRERYGYRRITMEMHNRGYTLNHKTISRLMAEMGLKCMVRKKKFHSYKGEVGIVADNIINRDFTAMEPYKKITTDITQIDINGKKCYLSPVLDMFNGEILSYSVSSSPDLKMVKDMMEKMFRNTGDLIRGAIMHSDQGWHYQHIVFREMLKEHGIVQSMSRKGNCLDNSIMESFFGLMKSELLYMKKYNSIDEFIDELGHYMEWYNNDRIKLRLNGKSPIQYKTMHFMKEI